MKTLDLKRTLLPAALLLSPLGCDDSEPNNPGGMADTDGMTTAQMPSGTTTGASDDTASSTPDGGDSSSDTEASMSETGAMTSGTETGMGSSDTGDEPVDPASLPWGGYIELVTNDLGGLANAYFLTIENADEPGVQLPSFAIPLEGDREEDTWTIAAEPNDAPGDPGPELERVFYDVGPEFHASGGNIEFRAPRTKDLGIYDAGLVELDEPWSGGSWTFEFEGSDDFAAATLDNVLETPGDEDVQFELTTDGVGVPTGFVWDSFGAHEVFVAVFAFGPEAGIQMCAGKIVDDGEAEFPDNCIDLEALGSGDYDEVFVLVGPSFALDIAHADLRYRVNHEVHKQFSLAYPFE